MRLAAEYSKLELPKKLWIYALYNYNKVYLYIGTYLIKLLQRFNKIMSVKCSAQSLGPINCSIDSDMLIAKMIIIMAQRSGVIDVIRSNLHKMKTQIIKSSFSLITYTWYCLYSSCVG